jgi:hypothetical protein
MNANAKTAADPADERWIEWIEPFGPNNEPVYCRVPPATAIASQRRVAEYPTDERALEDFMTVHWAARVPPPSVPQTLPPNAPPPPTDLVEQTRALLRAVEERIEGYAGGDRPPSPPARLLALRAHLTVAIRAVEHL